MKTFALELFEPADPVWVDREWWWYEKRQCPLCDGTQKLEVNGEVIDCPKCDVGGEIEERKHRPAPNTGTIKCVHLWMSKDGTFIEYDVTVPGRNVGGGHNLHQQEFNHILAAKLRPRKEASIYFPNIQGAP